MYGVQVNTDGIELSRRRLLTWPVLGLLLLGGVLVAVPSGYAAAPMQAASHPKAEGRWVSFRTTESDREPTSAHTEACRQNLGPALGDAAPIQLEADLFSFTTRRRSSVVHDETARRVGSGYLCVSGPDPTASEAAGTAAGYAEVRLPGVGLSKAEGGCELVPAATQPGAGFFNCRMRILPDSDRGIVGGFVTSNSVLNPAGVPGNATGSIWTAYVKRTSWPTTAPRAARVPGLVPGDVSGARVTFVSARGRPEPARTATCAGVYERVRLSRAQARLRTSAFPVRQPGLRVGVLWLCSPTDPAGAFATTGSVRVTGPLGDRVTLSAAGICRTPRPHGGAVRVCTLQLAPDPAIGVQGGFVTTVAPVRAGSVTGRRPIVTAALLPMAVSQP